MLSNERRLDMLIGAIEGGSGYWSYVNQENCEKIDKYQVDIHDAFSELMWKAIEAGETIEVHAAEDEDEKLGEINLTSIEKGEMRMMKEQPHHYGDIWSERDDAITADVWFQYCVMGEVIYG